MRLERRCINYVFPNKWSGNYRYLHHPVRSAHTRRRLRQNTISLWLTSWWQYLFVNLCACKSIRCSECKQCQYRPCRHIIVVVWVTCISVYNILYVHARVGVSSFNLFVFSLEFRLPNDSSRNVEKSTENAKRWRSRWRRRRFRWWDLRGRKPGSSKHKERDWTRMQFIFVWTVEEIFLPCARPNGRWSRERKITLDCGQWISEKLLAFSRVLWCFY